MVYDSEKSIIGNLLGVAYKRKEIVQKAYDFDHNAEEAKANAKEGDQTLLGCKLNS